MILIFLTIVITTSDVLSLPLTRTSIPKDATANFTEIANRYGYKTEEYDVLSEGGYILKMFRIPGNRKRPVLLVHGALDSSDSFIMRGNTSLAIALAIDNFDVWAMNCRGNRYSRRHITMNPDSDPAFWNFSLHELGYYDLPASIDFVLTKTGERRLSVIGFSEGTASMFVLGSTRPEYNDKVKVFIALAPVCYLQNTGLYMSLLIHVAPLLNVGLEATGTEEFMGNNSTLKTFINEICMQGQVGYRTCLINGLYHLTGSNPNGVEPEFFPVILGHFPAGTSRKNLNHLVQISLERKFGNYDYGLARNMDIYKRKSPPEYDLSKITMKIALIAAKNDKISTIEDTALLRKRLRNVIEYKVLKDNAFNHVDYIWGKNTYKSLFPDIKTILYRYN